jgi:hypothetical protein
VVNIPLTDANIAGAGRSRNKRKLEAPDVEAASTDTRTPLAAPGSAQGRLPGVADFTDYGIAVYRSRKPVE